MAVALFTPPPERDARALAVWGLTPGDFGGPQRIAVYPDCWNALQVFDALRTQWRVDFGRRTGLDYAALTPLFWQSQGIKKRHRAELFADLAVMERAALQAIDDTKGKD